MPELYLVVNESDDHYETDVSEFDTKALADEYCKEVVNWTSKLVIYTVIHKQVIK